MICDGDHPKRINFLDNVKESQNIETHELKQVAVIQELYQDQLLDERQDNLSGRGGGRFGKILEFLQIPKVVTSLKRIVRHGKEFS